MEIPKSSNDGEVQPQKYGVCLVTRLSIQVEFDASTNDECVLRAKT